MILKKQIVYRGIVFKRICYYSKFQRICDLCPGSFLTSGSGSICNSSNLMFICNEIYTKLNIYRHIIKYCYVYAPKNKKDI